VHQEINNPDIRDERTVIFCNPHPVLNFQNSVQVKPQSKLFWHKSNSR